MWLRKEVREIEDNSLLCLLNSNRIEEHVLKQKNVYCMMNMNMSMMNI